MSASYKAQRRVKAEEREVGGYRLGVFRGVLERLAALRLHLQSPIDSLLSMVEVHAHCHGTTMATFPLIVAYKTSQMSVMALLH